MSPPEPAELRRFLDAYLYEEAAFLVDEVTRLDREGQLVYHGDNNAIFIKNTAISRGLAPRGAP